MTTAMLATPIEMYHEGIIFRGATSVWFELLLFAVVAVELVELLLLLLFSSLFEDVDAFCLDEFSFCCCCFRFLT
jgi:hypothetical protein